MAHTAIAVLQTPWDCKWTRFTYRRPRSSAHQLTEPYSWRCVRERGERRRVDERDCEDCPHWEMADLDPADW
jgi:hypothetical protein